MLPNAANLKYILRFATSFLGNWLNWDINQIVTSPFNSLGTAQTKKLHVRGLGTEIPWALLVSHSVAILAENQVQEIQHPFPHQLLWPTNNQQMVISLA
jgi:hypothetical protein